MSKALYWPKNFVWDTIPRKRDLHTTQRRRHQLGDPHKKLPPTVHIAGTNGKGSTVAMLTSIFVQAGYVVHSYTSPHILSFNERIKLNNVPVADQALGRVLERVGAAADGLSVTPTFFEETTVAAFVAFSEVPADVLLLETGLGGRLDCTHVVDAPLLTIITTIARDHTEYLGNTLEEIAAEKAGIIKAGVPFSVITFRTSCLVV